VSRLPLLRSKTRLESPVSREATFLYNNLLLVAFCLTILWGVLYPILTEALRGEPVTVGPPYYNFFLKAFGLPLLVLMGIGPLIAWRRASLRGLGRTFAWPAGVAVLSGLALLALGAGSSIPGLVGYTFCAFVLASIVLEFTRGTRARRALAGGSWPAAFGQLVGRNRRRYGGYVVHASIVLLAIGVIGSSAYDTTREQRLRPGETMAVGDYRLTYRGATSERGANAVEVRAVVDVERDGKRLGTLRPGKNNYLAEQQVSNEAAIRSDKLNGEDLFLIAEQITPNAVFLKALVKPLVNLIWLAGFVFVGGALIALWPDAREQRRLALRYGRYEALAKA
jgi:cytochrome c-type biogenesis protein CcmF